jgi:hypothetical protein
MPGRSLLKQALTSKERQGNYGVNRAQYIHWESPHGFLLALTTNTSPWVEIGATRARDPRPFEIDFLGSIEGAAEETAKRIH